MAATAPLSSDAHHAAALVQRVLSAQAAFGSPACTRDPMSALRDLGGPWVENVCDPGGVVATTAAIENF